jgi:hypothetical protein
MWFCGDDRLFRNTRNGVQPHEALIERSFANGLVGRVTRSIMGQGETALSGFTHSARSWLSERESRLVLAPGEWDDSVLLG